MYAGGVGKLYAGRPQTAWEVRGSRARRRRRTPARPPAAQLVRPTCTPAYPAPAHPLGQVVYLVLTVAALDLLHDAWFYWAHRLLHWQPLMRHVHYLHHR